MAESTIPEKSKDAVLEKRRSEDFSAELAATNWYHSFELPGGRAIDGFLKLDELKERWAEFPLPASLRGKRLLDIGSWDGWFTYEAERRGAEVTAVDNVEQENFHYLHRELASRAEYRVAEVYELADLNLGRFDYTLFLGVLYHLRHPLRALEIVCELTTDIAIVDSFIVDDDPRGLIDSPLPWMEFYETTELSNQIDNWCGPTLQCLMALCRSAGFARVELLNVKHRHARLACYRHWEPPPKHPKEPAPILRITENGRFGVNGINFSTRKEEFMTCWFDLPRAELTRQELRLEVDGFGVPCLALRRAEGERWQANFMLPPGLSRGWRDVRLRAADTAFGNSCRIAIDMPVEAAGVLIHAVSDGITWNKEAISFPEEGDAIAVLWTDGLGQNCDRNNVRVYCGEQRLKVDFVSGIGEQGSKQVNARIPRRMGPGKTRLHIRCGTERSAEIEVELK
jgi:tRNA (mo5U34)-methyltransferase